MFPPYCPQEKPYNKRNEKIPVKTELRELQSISIEQKRSPLRPINTLIF